MNRSSEARAWMSIEAAQQRIRGRVFRTGMAGRYHVAKGTDIARDPGLIERCVDPLNDEREVQAYLQEVPRLIERMVEQDERCAESWASINFQEDRHGYDREVAGLAELLLKYRFKLRSYEVLVLQPNRPPLERANRLLADGPERGGDIDDLESLLKLTLREFVELEEATANDVRLIDEARAEIVSAHESWARELARSIDEADPEALRYPLDALARAAQAYNHRLPFEGNLAGPRHRSRPRLFRTPEATACQAGSDSTSARTSVPRGPIAPSNRLTPEFTGLWSGAAGPPRRTPGASRSGRMRRRHLDFAEGHPGLRRRRGRTATFRRERRAR